VKRSTDRILTTHPGRLPDPPGRDAVMEAREKGDRAAFDRLVKEGIGVMLRKQREIGIDLMSDGEFWKARDGIYYMGRASGIEAKPLKPGEWPSTLGTQRERTGPEFRDFYDAYDKLGNTPRPGVTVPPFTEKYVITGKVEARPATSIEQDIAVIKAALTENGVDIEDYFYPVLGPGWLDHFVFNEYYRTEEEYCFALAEIVKNDMKAVIEAGFILQIDDPGLCDRYGMIDPDPGYKEYRRQEAMRIEATNWAIKGLPEDRIRYHTCWGSWHTPHTTDIPWEHVIDLMLQVNAGAYSWEAADVRHELDYRVWENTKLPDGKIFIPGVIAHKTTTIETPELVADRLLRWADMFGRENVIAGVDCGVGGRCYPEVGWAKLKALVDGAAMASRMLWK
jgi:5-methyltetrahydropteroyltriglutamate--homocysteine methyltransferase